MALFNRYLFYQHDPDGTAAYRYYASEPQFQGYITTSGSSTTTTAIAGAPFAGLVAGDMLLARKGDTSHRRTIATATSSTSVAVNSAWDLSSPSTGWVCDAFKFSGGTASTDGWFFTGGLSGKQVQTNLITLGSTTVVVTIQGTYDPAVAGVDVVPAVSLSATGSDVVVITEDWPYMRVGLSVTGGPGTDSVTVFFSAATDNITN